MVRVDTPVCDFGWQAPDFTLPAVDGQSYSLSDVAGENGTLIMFICNHCPYVKSITGKLVSDCAEIQAVGIGVVAISANDATTYPSDSFENMAIFSAENNFSFPYLYDEPQSVARAYDAICTPDFFGFNRDLRLQYRGRFDSSGSNFTAPESRRELREAMIQISETGQGPTDQTASVGCSIKWRD
jgi:peroxiredoxin